MDEPKLDLDELEHRVRIRAGLSWEQMWQLIAAARRLQELDAVVRALGEWAPRQQAGEVCWPQPMHDGTLRIYAIKCAGTTPDVAQGADFLETAKALCVRLGIAWGPKAKVEP